MTRAGSGPDAGRVAQLRVTRHGGSTRGSGYRITDTAVLTAAHVVADAQGVEVVFNADLDDEWSAPAAVALCAPAGDVAVVTIPPSTARPHVEPARFGALGRRAAVLSCCAVGFPRFKLRASATDPYRDAHQADGTIASLSNWREGTLEIATAPPERDLDPDRSPWEGMSGAAVWCAGRIVGVVSRHHRSDGLGRLAAVRVGHWYSRLDGGALAELAALTGLPAGPDGVVDVITPEPDELAESAYHEYVEDIAPVRLQQRDAELAELNAFCAGNEPYAWWQAGPWAGKTALAAWFALHPPVGVTVVSFFITRRLAGQADSSAFSEAVVEQLTIAAREPGVPMDNPSARDGQRRRLLRRAAAQAVADGRRLLLLVDGLDEDEGVPPAGPSSIAALLPRRPIEGLRVLVTSRAHPGLPHDVPADHPLRRFRDDHPSADLRPRELTPSDIGEQLQVLAKDELVRHLHGTDQLAKDLIGHLAAAGGALTVRELGELTSASYVDLQARLAGTFGRSLHRRASTDFPTAPVCTFAHETLRALSEEQLGYDLLRYRERLHRWAETYRQQGWPSDTPDYLGRPYSRLLARTRDTARLVTLVTQPARHDRMLAGTLTDAAALAEILDTRQLLLDATEPDLTALCLIAVEDYRLSRRNQALPPQLPALWVRLGQPDRGESLARTITDPRRQTEAIMQVAKALAATGRADRAERLARALPDPDDQDRALAGVVDELVTAGQPYRAVELTRTIAVPSAQAEALVAVARALVAAGRADLAERLGVLASEGGTSVVTAVVEELARAGRADRAEQLARSSTNPKLRAEMLTRIVHALVTADRPDRAVTLARTLTRPYRPVEALAAIVRDLCAAGYPDHAEEMAGTIDDPRGRAEAMAAVARALVMAGQSERAERLADGVTDPQGRTDALIAVAEALVGAGLPDRAERLVTTISDPSRRADALTAVAETLVATGRPDRAEQLARTVAEPYRQSALARVVQVLTAAGQPHRGVELARTLTDRDAQARALTAIARTWRVAGHAERATDAEHLAAAIRSRSGAPRAEAPPTSHVRRWLWHTDSDLAEMLADVIGDLAAAGRRDRADRIAELASGSAEPDGDRVDVLAAVTTELVAAGRQERAEQLTRTASDHYFTIDALTGVAMGFAAAGLADRADELAVGAERLARTITYGRGQGDALATVVEALVAAGKPDEAEHMVGLIAHAQRRATAATAVAKALVTTGQPDRAERLARTLADPDLRTTALIAVAQALVRTGDVDGADRLARTLTEPHHLAQALTAIATVTRAAARPTPAWLQLGRLQPPNDPTVTRVVEEIVAARAAGQLDRAEELAGDLDESELRARALAAVAAAAAERDAPTDRARARRIAVGLVGTPAWPRAMPILAILAPAAVEATAAALLAVFQEHPAEDGPT